MDEIRKKIAGLGVFLAIAGVLSTVLFLVDYNLKILVWIDLWGEGVGWAIRIGLIVAGVAIFFSMSRAEDDHVEEAAPIDWDEYRRALFEDSRIQDLLGHVRQTRQITTDSPTDPETFRLVHWRLTDDSSQSLGADDEGVQYAAIYLERGAKPKRLQVSQDLQTGETAEHPLSGSQWHYLVPD